MKWLFLLTLIPLAAIAQHEAQPQKESATDLRTGSQVFHIGDIEHDKEVWLEKTAGLDFFLRMKGRDGNEQVQKISSKEARTLDVGFTSRFLKCKYELPVSPEGCKVTLRLSLKGETQDVCGKDDKKAQEIVPFLENLASRF